MNDTITTEEIKDISTMIKHMIVDYVDLDGRMFISNHDSDTTRSEITRHFNVVQYDCIKFVKKYDSILSDEYLNKTIKFVSTFIRNAKDLMVDLYDYNLTNAEITARALKRGDTSNEF